jgi:hypothetical protein
MFSGRESYDLHGIPQYGEGRKVALNIMRQPKILLFDIENAPNTAYIWGLWQETTSPEMIEREWYMLCWAAKWLGESTVYSAGLMDYPKEFRANPENDKPLLKTLWKLLDEADIVIAHNGAQFDVRKTNARFIMNGLTPPSPYKVIDTLLIARKHFFFTSNKLNDLGKYLKCGQKVETGGFKLWKKCMAGNRAAWKKMVTYCKNDVRLLEKIYLKLLPYIENHPNLAVYLDDDSQRCPNCASENIEKRGYSYTNLRKYQRYFCKHCGKWSRGNKFIKD